MNNVMGGSKFFCKECHRQFPMCKKTLYGVCEQCYVDNFFVEEVENNDE